MQKSYKKSCQKGGAGLWLKVWDTICRLWSLGQILRHSIQAAKIQQDSNLPLKNLPSGLEEASRGPDLAEDVARTVTYHRQGSRGHQGGRKGQWEGWTSPLLAAPSHISQRPAPTTSSLFLFYFQWRNNEDINVFVSKYMTSHIWKTISPPTLFLQTRRSCWHVLALSTCLSGGTISSL